MLKSYINRAAKSLNYTLPAPVGGLNLRDAHNVMPQEDALQMDNYMPLDTKVSLRKGYVDYVRTDSRFVTLVAYKKAEQNRFIGISQGQAYDLSSAQNITVYDGITFRSNRCQTLQYKDYLYFMNGEDTPKVFYLDDNNQDNFADWNFSGEGLTASKIISGCVSKQFLWFIEKGTMKVWYASSAGNVSGTLNCFDLSLVSRFGGHLMAVCCWTVDGGQGIDDLTVFITSEGEVLVYSGANPNSADDWSLKGSYKISPPIGYRCTMQYQGDIVVITESGYLPLSKVLPLNEAGESTTAFSDKISSLVLSRASLYKSKEGWQGIIYTKGCCGIFNVPLSQGYEQHVVNLQTGAWCRFTGIKSHCWAVYAGKIYFGTDYGVCLFDRGYSDNGVPITGVIRQAYNNLGYDGLKKVQMLNPRTSSSSRYSLTVYSDTDFMESNQNTIENIGFGGLTKWNNTKWSSLEHAEQSKWQTSRGIIRSQWIANSAVGCKISVVFKTNTRGNLIEWFDTGVRYERATGIL